jgi:RNA polymerase sigma-70 factor (ECF subfamily)
MKAWLFRILRNAHLDRRRRAPHDPLHLAAKGGSHEQDEEASWEPIDDRARDALAHIEASELYEAVMALEETYRTPLLLDLEGMTESEVAQVLECKVGTVKSRLSRAKEQLRRRLTTERRSKEDRDGQ